MILVLTKSLLEINADVVMDWLSFYKAEYAVITGDELLADTPMIFRLNNKSVCLKIQQGEDKTLSIDDIRTVWFRRRMEEASFLFYENLQLDVQGKHDLVNHLKIEFLRFYSLLPVYLKKAYWLSHPDRSSLNKLEVLIIAREIGLTIPETIITNFIKNFETAGIDEKHKYISKPLTETAIIAEKKRRYSMLTKEIEKTTLVTGSFFFPSLIQKCIEKEFEIRVFYLSGKCYSMAIFSQEDETTKTDYRNYDNENQNRCVPYKLPKGIEKKIAKLMGALKLNAGSIDFIKTPEEEYVFLEINPVGQFDWVGLNCNYPIEKDIAMHLIKKDQYEKRQAANDAAVLTETAGT